MKRLFLASLAAISSPAVADSLMPAASLADTQLADPRAEASAKALMEEVRCLVCQGQSIADSDADLAGDMRALVRERIQAGERPAAIRAWLVHRYGPWIDFRPPATIVGWPLWLAPAFLLIAGFALALSRFRRPRR